MMVHTRCLAEQNGMRIASWTLFRTILGGITKDLERNLAKPHEAAKTRISCRTLRRISFQDGGCFTRRDAPHILNHFSYMI